MNAFRAVISWIEACAAAALALTLLVVPAYAQQGVDEAEPFADTVAEVVEADQDGEEDVSRENELREWFQALSQEKRELLLNRYRAFRSLSREQQRRWTDALKNSGASVLDEDERDALGKLAGMSALKRFRLHLLYMEMQFLRRRDSREFNRLMQLSGKERVQALLAKVREGRLFRFVNSLDETARNELMQLPESERRERANALYAAAQKERIEAMARAHPRLARLLEQAETGDEDARRKAAGILRDLATLDAMLQMLEPDQRTALTEKIVSEGLSPEEAAELLHGALRRRALGRGSKGEHPSDRRPGGRRGKGERFPHRGQRGNESDPAESEDDESASDEG